MLYTFENLTLEQLGELLDRYEQQIKNIGIDLEEDRKPHRRLYTQRERDKMIELAKIYYRIHEQVYNEWEKRVRLQHAKELVSHHPILKQYRMMGIIRDCLKLKF